MYFVVPRTFLKKSFPQPILLLIPLCALPPVPVVSLCLDSFWVVFEIQSGISLSLYQFRYN